MMKALYIIILAALGLYGLSSCDDGDSFTTSPSNLLSFSTDTLSLDTVFSTVPSSTRSFWVYNNSGNGLRCANVRLEGGNQSGFRVNVDGAYLSQEQGYKVNDIEVRDKDSIRVYVEVTTAQGNSSQPRLVDDKLLFTLESGKQQEVALRAWSWDARFLRNQTVNRDSTITADKSVVVYGMLTVGEGATLTVEPGAVMYFHANAGIDVKGRIVSKGTPANNVVLRGDRLDRMFDYLPYNRVSGQWLGVHIAQSSYDNVIEYTDIHSSFDGIRVDSSDVSRSTLTLKNSTVHNCQGNVLYIANSKADVANTQLTNALGYCLAVDGGDVNVNNCTIAQFYPFDANRGSALFFSGQDYPLVAFNCTNTLVTGYSDDELTGGKPGKDSSNAFDYSFANCIIRTPEVDDEDKPHFADVVFEEVKDTVSAGRKHFVLVDGNNQNYDFRLRKESSAIDKANPSTATTSDRCGNPRGDKPDIGAYEYVEEVASKETSK